MKRPVLSSGSSKVVLETRGLGGICYTHNHTVPHTLTRVWQELEYRIDVCRVTRGAHIEHL